MCESLQEGLSNCVVVGNMAAVGGGGVYRGTLNDCLIRDNWSFRDVGGGALECTVVKCFLPNNLA
jgi:hypothetical protein